MNTSMNIKCGKCKEQSTLLRRYEQLTKIEDCKIEKHYGLSNTYIVGLFIVIASCLTLIYLIKG